MPEQLKLILRQFVPPIILMLSLVYMRIFNGVLVFHTFAELFSIIVGVMMFVIVKNSQELTYNHFLTFLGIGYFWIAILDTYHAFTMTGMLLFDSTNFEITIHFWVYTRILEALLLLTALKHVNKEVDFGQTFTAIAAISIIVIWVSFNVHEPQFMTQSGLTLSKIIAELFVIVILAVTLFLYYRKRKYFSPKVLYLLYASILLTIGAEVSFTHFSNIDDSAFVVGHLFKFLSFWMIFKAIIVTSLKEPISMMAKTYNSYDSIPSPSIVINEMGVISRLNRSAVALVNKTEEILIGENVHKYFHPNDIPRDECPYCNAIAEQKSIHNELLYYPNYERWFLYSVAKITSGVNVVGMVQTLTDVTHQKQIEEELSNQKEQLRMLLDTTSTGLVLCRMDGSLVKVNNAYAKIIGRSIEDTLKLSYWEITPEKYAEQEKLQLASLKTEGKYGPYRKEYIHKQGHMVPVELKGTLLKQETETYIWSVVEDLSERIESERRLLRSEKMDAIGQLSGGIAHDFNNILGVILGNIEIIKVKSSLEPDIEKYLASIEKAGQRAAKLTNQLLDYSRNKADKLEVINIGDIIAQMQNLIERSLTPEVSVALEMCNNLSLVEISKGDFQDALLNLVINARDAMQGRGQVVLRANDVKLTKEFCQDYPDTCPGNYVQLEVIDNGVGITEEEIDHIFEPFFTTKEPGKGTGLGLTMVFGFIRRCKGIITCESSLGIGTNFSLYFPVTQRKVIQPLRENPIVAKQGNQETILLVDDEIGLLKLTVEQLEILNYRVLATSKPTEALNWLKTKPEIDMLMSDIVMPGELNGYELAEQAQNIRPDIKLLLISGFSANKVKKYGRLKLDYPILQKPYNHNELANVLREILD